MEDYHRTCWLTAVHIAIQNKIYTVTVNFTKNSEVYLIYETKDIKICKWHQLIENHMPYLFFRKKNKTNMAEIIWRHVGTNDDMRRNNIGDLALHTHVYVSVRNRVKLMHVDAMPLWEIRRSIKQDLFSRLCSLSSFSFSLYVFWSWSDVHPDTNLIEEIRRK